MARVSRRTFIRGSAAAGAAFFISSARSQVLGANESVRVAVVGFNSKGKTHIAAVRKMNDARLVALCDVDQNVIDGEMKALGNPSSIQTYSDIRKLLDNKSIDAIFIATPNHWHSLAAVWGCQAGKDVYVEKPCSHEVWEGYKVVEAARKYNRIVQHGTQSRSDTGLKEAMAWIAEGHIGKMQLVRGLCYKERDSIGKAPGPQPIPPGVDYDLWCGPAPKGPLMRLKLHYDWHWFWPTGNGDIGNQGVHQMDICRWFTGTAELPPRVLSFGGKFVYDDDATTPNTLCAYYDYQPVPVMFEVRGLRHENKPKSPMDSFGRTSVRVGNIIHCEGGILAWGESGGWAYDKDGKKIKQFVGDSEGRNHHQANFIAAVRSRNRADLHAEIAEGAPSAALCHLGNISYRCGKTLPPGDIADAVKATPAATEALQRVEQHLESNGVDLKASQITLGPWLTMDPTARTFTGDFSQQANQLLRRDYRKPFEVPEKV